MNVITKKRKYGMNDENSESIKMVYKRISYFETSSKSRKDKFILDLLRNYPENQIQHIIKRNLNIPLAQVPKEIEYIKEAYPQWQKSQRRSKAFDQSKQQLKPTGIVVEIKHKEDGINIRVSGATQESYLLQITEYLRTVLFYTITTMSLRKHGISWRILQRLRTKEPPKLLPRL